MSPCYAGLWDLLPPPPKLGTGGGELSVSIMKCFVISMEETECEVTWVAMGPKPESLFPAKEVSETLGWRGKGD